MKDKEPRERIHKMAYGGKVYIHRGDKMDCMLCQQKAPAAIGPRTGGKW